MIGHMKKKKKHLLDSIYCHIIHILLCARYDLIVPLFPLRNVLVFTRASLISFLFLRDDIMFCFLVSLP